ncbi:MipA/OmpV family protein [Seongchinamella sediminis]|uniref:MipA/OmpV family protein n=1 Tax=Seongchinamella sediminis TaxID=2283635 RepID=A0A3L7E0J5_9GAMM|nr:MipA/OmpV family protein [Seongchinamella sediminis]RLQ23367.1 MipA/OmpV family protein [Seongchinamella sediminis]
MHPFKSVRPLLAPPFWLIVGFALPGITLATNPVTEIATADVPEGTLGLGLGWRWGDSPYRGIGDISSIETGQDSDLMPFYYYEGRYLFAHGSSAGIHLLNGDSFSLDALVSYRFDRLEPERDVYFDGVEEREQSLDGGLRGSVRGDWGSLSLTWLQDTLDRHNGEELDLTYRYNWIANNWTLSPFASYVHWDEALTDYYYGVSAAEARDDLLAYHPGQSSRWRAGLNTSYRMSKRMRLFANLALDVLDDEVSDSPLVDADQMLSAMVGVAYAFGNVLDDPAASRRNRERTGEWSWRVNAGYTAEHTFHKVHRGAVKQNDSVDTYLAGLTLSKLALDGRRIDVWGRVSVNRRLENGYQEDFWEVNPYIMLMGTGYSPWSNRELFRYGFGYGFSYADKVPYVEQRKQEKRGNNTSHFLNYLEATVDFPLRNLFGESGWWRRCYSGLTIVHRSGMFARVDILGNVDGGSDVLTAHLECKR